MIQMKLCMVGSFAVGKSSLVKRYVQSIFTDNYHTTVGVKVDKKDVVVGSETVRMMIWDLAGEDAFSRLQTTFLRGSAGYLLVADGTRAHTLDVALELQRQIQPQIRTVNAQTLQQLDALLTPEQQQKFHDNLIVFKNRFGRNPFNISVDDKPAQAEQVGAGGDGGPAK